MTTATLSPIVPVVLGPTWRRHEDWQQREPQDQFVLPELTMGWQVLAWVRANLLGDDREPFAPTFEQSRFILWWFAVDEHGRFVYRDGVLQRLKGWGKDPLGAVICAVELIGPSRFERWATVLDDPAWLEANHLAPGDPVAARHPQAWIQVAGVSREGTKNTMTLFPSLFSKECKREHKLDMGKSIIYAHGGESFLESVTSSPATLEGARSSFVLRGEPHHWRANNEGHEMQRVISRNLTKSKGGTSRALSITNGYEPAEDSVAQRQREAWEDQEAGLAPNTRLLYDSLEAPANAKITWSKNPDGSTPTDDELRAYITSVLEVVRGDAWWLDIPTIVDEMLSPMTNPATSRRFYYNQIVSAADAWLLPESAKTAVDPLLAGMRREPGADQLRVGWLVLPEEPVVVFFDGSKSDDATALVGCRVDDGFVFTLGVWQKPPGVKDWLVPRNEVDHRVREVMDRFNVVAFYGDPSHAKDDDLSRFWDPTIDEWHRLFKDRLQVWAVRTGDRQHSIMWDMTSPERTSLFTAAAELFVSELEDEAGPQFRLDGHPALMDHLKNARRYPNRFGISLWKGHRESAKKIDLAVAAVGARMLRRLVINKGLEAEGKGGDFWGF